MRDHQKEFDWEIVPYTEDSYDFPYCIWVHHPAAGPMAFLSGTSDCNEAIELHSQQQVDELINRLQLAREVLPPTHE